MLPFILWLVVAQQVTPDMVPDLEFARVQVEWLAESRLVRNLEDVLPRKQAFLVRQLDCSHWECRQLARDALQEMGAGAYPALVWGTRMKGRPEVVSACNYLIGVLFACPECGGSGFSEHVDESEDDEERDSWYVRYCVHCHRSGDLRYRLSWVDGREVLEPQVLFPRAREDPR